VIFTGIGALLSVCLRLLMPNDLLLTAKPPRPLMA
jgi:hypothetical protein